MCRDRHLLVSPYLLKKYLFRQLTINSKVDGAAWRTSGGTPGTGFKYPDFLLSDEIVSGVKGTKKAKL